jgi:glycosyltransferase involved in cell wall biosynthesis
MARVALLSQGSGPGGVESVVRSLADGLETLGHETDVLVMELSRDFAQSHSDSRGDGWRLHRLNATGHTSLPTQVLLARRLLKDIDPDVVISMKTLPMIIAPWIAGGRARLLGCEHLAGAWSGTGVKGFIRRTGRGQSLPRFHGVGALTRLAQEELTAIGVLDARLVENPVGVGYFGSFEDLKAAKVIIVSRLVAGKGLLEAVDAWAEVGPDFTDWTLEIIGSGPLEPILRQRIYEKGLASSVILAGAGENLAPRIASASIALSASDYEVLPTTVREAMACGTAVVASRSCVFVEEVLGRQGLGMTFSVGDKEGLVQALRTAMNDQQLRETIALGAREIAEGWRPSTIAAWWMNWAVEDPVAHRVALRGSLTDG